MRAFAILSMVYVVIPYLLIGLTIGWFVNPLAILVITTFVGGTIINLAEDNIGAVTVIMLLTINYLIIPTGTYYWSSWSL